MQLSPAVRRKARALTAGLAALALAACGVASSETVQNSGHGQRAGDWATWQYDTNGSRYNANEHTLTPGNAKNLELKYAYTFGNVPFSRVGSQPTVSGGVLFVGGPDGVFTAMDAKTGKTRWTFNATDVTGQLPDGSPNGIRDSAAVARGKVYFGDSTGRIFALDQRTGKLRWVKQASTQPNSAMTSSPLVVGNRLYVGVSTLEAGLAGKTDYACCKHRGMLVSLNADTGAKAWDLYTMRAAEQVGTWPSGAAKLAPSGGSVWSSPVADLESRTLFVGTGQNATGEEGDIDSVLAVSMDTGKVRWRQRMTFPDTYTTACEKPDMVTAGYCPSKGKTDFDADFGASANVVHVNGRTLVTIGQKNGMYYAFDARTGSVAWRTELAPGPYGGVGVQWGSVFDGRYLYAATWYADPAALYKIDAATGRIVWKSDHPKDGCTTGGAAAYPDVCAMLYTPAASGSPGLVYEGSADGKFRVFAAKDGKVLYTYDAIRDFDGVNGVPGRGSALSGNGGAVVADGMVYVMAGYYPFYPTDKGVVMLAFGLK